MIAGGSEAAEPLPSFLGQDRMRRSEVSQRREPMGLGAAIGALVTERAWELPAAGASLRERWAAIAPKLAAHVAAVGYDADTGRLTVCPESSAWATQTRLEQARVIEVANESAGRTVVRALKILAPGTAPMPEPADAGPEPAPTPAGPVRTRETASPGYRRALAAHQEAAPPRRADPAIADAVERQTAALRELSRRAFPDTDIVPADAPAPIEQALVQRRRQAAATEAAALGRARAEPGRAAGTQNQTRHPGAA
ncbi:DciA family protein [Streptomyces sp. NPDC014685]|uniref:DciA family protein n=1 Tax=Streptomyces sp. NPDC014685 TaxID=3364881 RepID=UPI0037025081